MTAGPTPDLAAMRAIISRLAGDEFRGRRIGTPGGRAAAGWLADHLRASGATVLLDEFSVAGVVREVYDRPNLAVDGIGAELVFRRDFCEHLASADLPGPVTGRVVAADAVDMTGAWILDAALSPDRATRWPATGALGVLVPRGTDADGWMPKMIAGSRASILPVLAVRAEVHERMRTTAGPLVVTASVPVRTVDVVGINVIGTLRPPTGGLSVLLTAHFDGVGDDPHGLRFPAACDNAAGVAAVLDAVRILHRVLPARVGLAVALLDGEEAGAQGAAHHARFVEDGTFVINLDGAAELAGPAAVEAGGPAQPLLTAVDLAGRQTGVPLAAQAMPSDNRRFATAGLPAVGIGMGMPGYQTPVEHPDRVQSAALSAAVRLLVATVVNLTSGFNSGRSTLATTPTAD